MKDNKILKILSYILIAISVPIFILSILTYKESRAYVNEYEENEESDRIVSAIMNELSTYARLLVHNQKSYTQVQDGDTTIFYTRNPNEYNNIQNLYVYIKYQDKIITNAELTSETNTEQGIRDFINAQDTKKLSIINGKVTSDTDIINKKAVQYFENFNIQYYTLKYEENNNYEDDVDYEYRTIRSDEQTAIDEFEIYASYDEKVIEPAIRIEYMELINKMKTYSNLTYIAIPVSSLIALVCTIYLFYAIGKELGTLDKVYYEAIVIIALTLIGFAFLPIAIIFEGGMPQNDLYFIISMGATAYFISYTICAVVFNTTIKRIKAKSFWKTTIVGKITSFILKKMKELYKDLKQNYKDFMRNLTRNKKLILYMIGFIVIEIMLLSIFNFLGFILDIILGIYVFNKIMKNVYSYEKIENKLKDMYEGNNETILRESDVEEDFKDSVKYINDISNGFENAIEESLKSEKLKAELITNVSHDIKTPLTSIINYVDLLKQEEIDNEKAKEYIEVLDSKSQRLKKLTEDLVEASKASSGAIKLNIEKINIVELLKQSIGEFEDKFNARNLEIITSYEKEDVTTNADSRYLYRVIENVFSNISKYALESSRVYIDVIDDMEKVKITVKNISKEKLNISSDELMQRFVRGDKSRTTEGSGLGISIAKSLVELQKGKFDLQIDGDLFKVIIELPR